MENRPELYGIFGEQMKTLEHRQMIRVNLQKQQKEAEEQITVLEGKLIRLREAPIFPFPSEREVVRAHRFILQTHNPIGCHFGIHLPTANVFAFELHILELIRNPKF